MVQSSAIATLINLHEEKISNIEIELAKISQLKILEEKKIKELEIAEKEFSKKMHVQLAKGCSIQSYQSQNMVLNNFYLNIEKVKHNITILEEQHDLLMKSWQEQYKKNIQFNTLAKRQESINLLADNKKEQKSADEHSLRSFIGKNKKS